jgi:acyl-CoA synthetase (AMP-forming)/AMP-acid ligase II
MLESPFVWDTPRHVMGDTVFKSPLPDVAIPEVTVHGLIDAMTAEHSERTALIDGVSGRSITYRELGEASERVAAGLTAVGVQPGDTVALSAPNSVDWPIAALGVIRAGGVLTGTNPAYTSDELAHQLRDSGARAVISGSSVLETVTAAAQATGTVEELIVLDGPTPELDGMRVHAFSALGDSDAPPVTIEVDLDDVCALPYSSGTTGRSKGVRLTHRTLLANVCQTAALAPIEPGDQVLAFLPMFHIMGFSVVALGGLAKGATLVTLPGFEPRSFLGALQDQRIKTVFIVPPIANFLAAHPMVDEYDLSALETIGCGAAPLGAEMEEALGARLGCQMAQGYGMTESSGCISFPRFSSPLRSGSSGVLIPNTEAVIIDPLSGQRQPAGSTGELWFRGPQVFAGYLHNPQATAETIDADGWAHTGDLGHFDDDGFLHITDRLKELIKVKAFQVAPAELEALLMTHPQVEDAAVIGRPDERAGERPVAYVVARNEIRPDEIQEWVASRVAEYKQLAAVVRTDAIPKNASGKILRRVLRETDAATAA